MSAAGAPPPPNEGNPYQNSFFDFTASFFVEVAYNGLYLDARDRVKKQGGSLLETYKETMRMTSAGLRNDKESYHSFLNKLIEYLAACGMRLTFGQFTEKLVSYLMPKPLLAVTKTEQKDIIVASVIYELFAAVEEFILKPDVLPTIMVRTSEDYASKVQRPIQEHGVATLVTLQSHYYSQFVKKSNNNTAAGDHVQLTARLGDRLRRALTAYQVEKKRTGQLAGEIRALRAEMASREQKYIRYIKLMRGQRAPPKPDDRKSSPGALQGAGAVAQRTGASAAAGAETPLEASEDVFDDDDVGEPDDDGAADGAAPDDNVGDEVTFKFDASG